MLYDCEKGMALVDPEKLKQNPLYIKLESMNRKTTIDAIFRRIHKFLDSQQPSIQNHLVWVRLSKLIGRNSRAPHADIVFIEDRIAKTFGEHSTQFTRMGGLLFMIAIAETTSAVVWLTNKNPLHEMMVDKATGNLITWRGYWISDTFVPPQKKKTSKKTRTFKKPKRPVQALKDKFRSVVG